ncbi:MULTISPECIES: adenine phosphoribosyltransferase [Maribacter]|uniref:Adenine phosphoribosyltransferase n=1 Tax=Maribacter flavus TaxID=1658664 RepID=A0A5B2TVB0_9FLAO|nr:MULTISPECIES: adenine phosphoribosyltransferase [Maribacter]KAA2218234.1 adenine phosphoribosyltransferase [Maribacter flavus]MDC6405042.1 adenine phosphoribosyltransferase [Maribacter sp. PR66]MEE1972456.1 adenine phosphoribosyltransferase [Maribacter flavus]
MDFKSYIRDVPDFPKPGIIFKDITPLLQSHWALSSAADSLIKDLKKEDIDKVVGMESRGFIFGPMLAERLESGFVPIRKPGKLPYKTLSESYNLEYGTDTLEIHVDGITKGDRVLIHDDVLATGGTALATTKLVEKLGGIIVQCNFLIELSFLNGREKIKPFKVKSLITY